jgi:hypothetical protein
MAPAGAAVAGPLQQGMAAYQRQGYVKAAQLLRPLAERGDAQAQTYLGFMYEYGRGVPQSYAEAAIWYCLAAEQGHAQAQYLLGLIYDKGFGVRRDYVEAHKWLNLAAAHAPRKDREDWVRIRDAVASKMTIQQIALAQRLAEEWRPKRLIRSMVVVGKLPATTPEVVIQLK